MHESEADLDARTGYDRWAPVYDDADPSTRLEEPVVRALCGPVRGRRALDLGCGTGRYARLLAAGGARVVGLDLSWGMLRRARSTGGTTPARWIQGSAETLPFAAGVFDVVVSGLVLDHLPDPRPCMREVARVLRPGGVVVLSAVHPDLQRRTGPAVRFRAEGRRWRIPGFVHPPGEVAATMERMGLEVTAERTLRVDAHAVRDRPDWRDRLGRPALLVLAARKPNPSA